MRCASEWNRPSGSRRARSTTFSSCSDMPPDVDASDMVPSCRSHSHGPPLLGRVRVANKFPGVKARMQPSDFLASVSRDFGSPRQRPTSMQELVLNRLRMPLQTRSASETDHRLSERPGWFEERGGPPGLLGRPIRACRTRSLSGAPPLRMRLLLAPTPLRGDLRRGRHRLQGKQNPRHPENHSFRGQMPTAHTLACLRFADPVTETVARLATDSGGLTPRRAGLFG